MRKREEITLGEPKTVRINAACQRYGLGETTMRKIAKDAEAVIKVGKVYLINVTRLDAYLDSMTGV